jgi:hypothetical protein
MLGATITEHYWCWIIWHCHCWRWSWPKWQWIREANIATKVILKYFSKWLINLMRRKEFAHYKKAILWAIPKNRADRDSFETFTLASTKTVYAFFCKPVDAGVRELAAFDSN